MAGKVLKVALTGGIASGKSLVSDLLEIHGCHIVDLDVISREIVLPGTEGLNELVESFGDSILLSDGSLDRKNLRDVLYKKGRNRAKIEQILHPKILQKMKSSMESFKEGVMVVVIPLLVEKELWGPFDRAVVVDCDVDTQIKRLTVRENIDNAKAQTMLMAQASREQRVQLSDHLPTDIINNNSKISDLKGSIESLSQKLFALV
ncbi:dephospho-CoA kinase [Candidatus Pseudothioglobus singularis]|nr:dephospho-CoA kinase [Candidatus Pseudothioglobus singularis]MDB4847724.1 dephospho-CoA kinase [Candidatus Pseudothioglobus singularis]